MATYREVFVEKFKRYGSIDITNIFLDETNFIQDLEGAPPPPNGSTSGVASIRISYPSTLSQYDGISYILSDDGVNWNNLGNYQVAKVWFRITFTSRTDGSGSQAGISVFVKANQTDGVNGAIPNTCYLATYLPSRSIIKVEKLKNGQVLTDVQLQRGVDTIGAGEWRELVLISFRDKIEVVINKIEPVTQTKVEVMRASVIDSGSQAPFFTSGGAGIAIYRATTNTDAPEDFWLDYFRAEIYST